MAARADQGQRKYLEGLRAERFELMEKLAKLPSDMIFFTQITMRRRRIRRFLDAMRKARSSRERSWASSGDPRRVEGRVKGLQLRGETLVERLQAFKSAGSTCSARSSSALPATGPRPSKRRRPSRRARG